MEDSGYTDTKNHFFSRIAFSSIFLLGLVYNMFSLDKVEYIPNEECMRDYTFIWTNDVNQYLRNNIEVKNRFIIEASTFMDFMIYCFLLVYLFRIKTFRAIIAYAIFFSIRSTI